MMTVGLFLSIPGERQIIRLYSKSTAERDSEVFWREEGGKSKSKLLHYSSRDMRSECLIAQNTETILQKFTREPWSVLHTMACRRVDMRLIPLLLLLLVAPLATVTRKYKNLEPFFPPWRRWIVFFFVRRVCVGWGLRVEPALRWDVRGGAVRPGQVVGEPRVQRRVPLRRMRRRPLRLPRLRPRRRPGMPLPGLATYPLHGRLYGSAAIG
jgi:hypothetical protein